jgi:predicted MFS family arabinose efflux permease
VIAADLGVAGHDAAIVVTTSQLGYAAGLLLLVPLGDMLDRRALVTRLLLACAVALGVAALAPSLAVLAVALAAVGVLSVVAQIVVPMASTLAPEHERGTVVGMVMSGLLIGILAARTVAGLVAEVGSWRLTFWLGAAAMVALALALWRALPGGRATEPLPYRRLIGSVFGLVRQEPLLRRRMVYGACGMGTFSVLWTSLSLLLAEPPYDYGEAAIGLFGLAGIAGAVAAQASGRLADAGHRHGATGTFWALVALGWLALLAGETTVALILLGIVVLDAGVQGQHILNQSTIFAIDERARSRLNTAYMTSNFLWGAIGSGAVAWAWSAHGWPVVCAIGGLFAVVALAMWAYETVSPAAPGTGRPRGSSSAP